MEYALTLANLFEIKKEYAQNIITLLDDGNTIPFIARYRKEMHGSMDDQLLRAFSEKLEYLRTLDKRREEIRTLIRGQEQLTDTVNAALDNAQTLSELEDIYRPYRPKRKTRASVAKERGLEPLAQAILGQEKNFHPLAYAEQFLDEKKDVPTVQDAIRGAMDIIAEMLSDSAEIRKKLRTAFRGGAMLKSVAVHKEQDSVYTNYYDFCEPVKSIAGHRILAINRGEKEGFLKVGLTIESEPLLRMITACVDKHRNPACSEILEAAGEDAYTRLIFPSIEREIRAELTEAADENAMKVFATNLKQLLMQPPLKGKTVLGLDPGYRTGCKVAVVDDTGKVLDTAVIYPTHSAEKIARSKQILLHLIKNIR